MGDWTPETVLARLKASSASSANLAGMARYGINTAHRIGASVPTMRALGREIGRDHALALALWKTGVADARIVAALIADPARMTSRDMDAWARDFELWDAVDQVCANLFEKTPHARAKVLAWAERKEEFVKRAAFALIACIAWHDRKASDAEFIAWLEVIKAGATDERNYVRKAVNWALRHIGKRNRALNVAAIAAAQEIAKLDAKAARWIAADALRELRSEAIQKRLG